MTKLSQRIRELHQAVRTLQPNLTRIAVALYDAESDLLSTYAYSSDIDSPLLRYSFSLQQSPSLQQMARSGQSRIINDMRKLTDSPKTHTRALLNAGYLSSFTLPIRIEDQLLGFIFFNSSQVDDFSHHLIPQLEIAAFAISLLVSQERSQMRTLQATMKTAVSVTHERDPETGEHLRRMADYSRFASKVLGPKLNFSDEFSSHLVLFSSLHDIGKISIPDHILLKPGKLMHDEFEIMKSHTTSGRKIIDDLINNHALDSLDHIEMLRNIVELHHENWDGSGYPHGLAGDQIPIAARIIAACDAFDAITTERPYKKPIPTDHALEIIQSMREKKLDPVCADIFLQHPEEVDAIRRQHLIDGVV
ncbi:MAG: HD domain-containing phosphohydrolase [Halopseudomonas sp.]